MAWRRVGRPSKPTLSRRGSENPCAWRWHDAHETRRLADSRVSWKSTRPRAAPASVRGLSGGVLSATAMLSGPSVTRKCGGSSTAYRYGVDGSRGSSRSAAAGWAGAWATPPAGGSKAMLRPATTIAVDRP